MIANFLKKKGIDKKAVKELWKKETGVYVQNIEHFQSIFPKFSTWIANKIKLNQLESNGFNFSDTEKWVNLKEEMEERKIIAYSERKLVNENGKKVIHILQKNGIKEAYRMKEMIELFLKEPVKYNNLHSTVYGKMKDAVNNLNIEGFDEFIKSKQHEWREKDKRRSRTIIR